MNTAKALTLSTLLLSGAYDSLKADINSVIRSIQNIPSAYEQGSGVDSVRLFVTDKINGQPGIFPFAITTSSSDTSKINPFVRAGGVAFFSGPNGSVYVQAPGFGPGLIHWTVADSNAAASFLTSGQVPRLDQSPYVKNKFGSQNILSNAGSIIPFKLSNNLADNDAEDNNKSTYTISPISASDSAVATSYISGGAFGDTGNVVSKRSGIARFLVGRTDPNGLTASDTLTLNISFPTTSIQKNLDNILNGYGLGQNYPNPFNPTTKIPFTVKNAGYVTIDVYDALGRKIRNVADGEYAAGSYVKIFDASNLANGPYFYKITSKDGTQTKKMTLIK